MSNCFGIDSKTSFNMYQNAPKRPAPKVRADSAEKLEIRRRIEDKRLALELGLDLEDFQ